MTPEQLGALERYTLASQLAAGRIIATYSTSFGAATRLLGRRHRTHIRSIYALVRVADELVDGATADAGMPHDLQCATLSGLEDDTYDALRSGYSSNPIIQAFAHTARLSGIDRDLIGPFFASMRADLEVGNDTADATSGLLIFGDEAHASYVHGSAEVIGLMCLRVFMRDAPATGRRAAALEHSARRLGAAFQNVNFLRDLADDTGRLGRSYLSGSGRIDEVTQERWISTIEEQLADARASLPLLPRDARLAVDCAIRLFARLNQRLARTPADQLYRRRIRVPAPEKALLIAQAALGSRLGSAGAA